MELPEKQRGVVRGVIPAALLSLVGLCGVSLLLPATVLPVDEPGARLAWALQWSLLPILTLMVAIGRVANLRFYTPEDIDGAGLTDGTPQTRLHRAILQNTLEQAVLAVAAYAIWAVVMPYGWLRSIPVGALLFVAGRLLFTRGYTRGAPGRALGFGLTAYPTFGMLATVAVVLSLRLLNWLIRQ
ncbi:MAG TPA: MAPEG family protein [Candidatus Binatia bacterium]